MTLNMLSLGTMCADNREYDDYETRSQIFTVPGHVRVALHPWRSTKSIARCDALAQYGLHGMYGTLIVLVPVYEVRNVANVTRTRLGPSRCTIGI